MAKQGRCGRHSGTGRQPDRDGAVARPERDGNDARTRSSHAPPATGHAGTGGGNARERTGWPGVPRMATLSDGAQDDHEQRQAQANAHDADQGAEDQLADLVAGPNPIHPDDQHDYPNPDQISGDH
jgi:hypothetical protein